MAKDGRYAERAWSLQAADAPSPNPITTDGNTLKAAALRYDAFFIVHFQL